MTLFRQIALASNEVTFANPTDINHTLRVVASRAPKTAGPVSLTNVRGEMVESIKLPVTNGTDNSTEVGAIRIVVSGSTQNKAALRAAFIRASANYLAALDDGLLEGFLPQVGMTAVAV